MRIHTEDFGALHNGARAALYSVENAAGMSVSLCDYGARIVRLCVPDGSGRLTDVVLGHDDVTPYIDADDCLGAICGRCANRLSGGTFTLDGRTYHIPLNNGENALHGGVNGFHRRLWKGEALPDGVCFSYTAADGEEGFPGTLHVRVSYRLTEDNRLAVEYDAISGGDTVVNLTNHSYFNLAGHGSGTVHGQTLQIFADYYTPADAALLLTGEVVSVADTPFDFRQAKPIGRDIDSPNAQLRYGGGYDHNFVLRKPDRGALTPAARASYPASGRTMEVWTTQPGLQLYTANALAPQTGKQGAHYDRRGAFCLETQLFPDAMRHTHFPSPLLKAGENLQTRTEFRFSLS